MDTSSNMDTLDDSSTLPELSFDDFIDSSPIKKNGKTPIDEDPLDCEYERKTPKDDTLNTPGPKKPLMANARTMGNNSISSKATTVRTNPVKAGNPLTASLVKNNGGGNGGNTSAPILLNSKNVLPKMATQITNNSIKITPKTISSTAGSGGVTTATGSGGVSMTGKTAVRTSSGQLIYIQKNPSTSSSSAIKSGGSTINMKQQIISAGSTGGGSKPVTIQVVRNADGNFVPVKPSAAGANAQKTTLTLSPTTFAGKKIVTASGSQLLIKSATTASSTSNSNTALKTTAEGMGKHKTIVVQSSSGKQIIVSNPVKLSPKTQNTTASGTSAATSSGSGTGQLHAIQIPGKSGLQYVRVMPTSKVNTKPVTVSSASTTSSSMSTKTVTTSSASSVTTSAPVKILNNLPQKFTVLQKGTGTKVVVTQKKDTNNVEFSPIASKVQKTIVTMPSLRPINDEKSKQQQQSLIKSQQGTSSVSNTAANQSLIRKHKISEINSEIKRITAAADADDSGGPPEIKKSAPNNRLVVISSNAPKILNSSIQQPGRVTVTSSSTSSSVTSSGAIQVQGAKFTPSSSTSANSSIGNKLYTILKPSATGQQPTNKLYSVLKPSSGIPATTQQSASSSLQKPLFNKQSLLHQQQKIFHLKQLQKPKLSQTSTTSSSSSTFVPLKIKEEPLEFPDSSTTATEKPNSSSFTPPSTSAASALQPLSMVPTVQPEDPNKIDLAGVRRKHCNCSKSQCLKLYCDCFANGEFCQDCTCKDCFNNLANEDERQKAIKSCLERNPSAFKPKITSSRDQGDMRLHNKGCNCKRSGCLKNYCECYEAKIPCSSNCKCVGCRNVEDRPDLDMDPVDPKVMASMANVSAMSNNQKRGYDKAQRDPLGGVAIKTEKNLRDGIKSEFLSSAAEANSDMPSVEKQQCNFITQEVVDATIQCMITQADECEKNGLPAYQMEKMVMEELGRCLVEIIDFSIRNTDTSYSQD